MSEQEEPILWGELARLYDEAHPGGRRARTLPPDVVFYWAEKQTDKFRVDAEGNLYHTGEKR